MLASWHYCELKSYLGSSRSAGCPEAAGDDGRVRDPFPHPDGGHVHRVRGGHRGGFHHHLWRLSGESQDMTCLVPSYQVDKSPLLFLFWMFYCALSWTIFSSRPMFAPTDPGWCQASASSVAVTTRGRQETRVSVAARTTVRDARWVQTQVQQSWGLKS